VVFGVKKRDAKFRTRTYVYNQSNIYTRRPVVRTNIVIDDKLMAEALRATGARTKREAVELGLKTLIRLKKQERIRGFRGRIEWRDDLERMRAD